MKVIQENGREVSFDGSKIRATLEAANNGAAEADRLSPDEIDSILKKIGGLCALLDHPILASEIRDIIIDELVSSRHFNLLEIKKDKERNREPIKAKERPGPVLFAKTIKETTPWGNLYVTLNFAGTEHFEVFLHIGKSGSEITAMTEAMARLISIGLRHGCPLEDLINTLKGLSGKEYWMFDCDDKRVVRSLPEAVALLLEKLNTSSASATLTVQAVPKAEASAAAEVSEILPTLEAPQPSRNSDVTCPECGAPMELMAGCAYCLSCGYSPCK